METALKDEAFKSKKLGKVVPISCIFDDAQLDRFSKLIPNLGILALLLLELGILAILPELQEGRDLAYRPFFQNLAYWFFLLSLPNLAYRIS